MIILISLFKVEFNFLWLQNKGLVKCFYILYKNIYTVYKNHEKINYLFTFCSEIKKVF